MNSDVSSEIVPTGESSPAPLTLVAFLSCVSTDVIHQGTRVGEASPADVTLVRFLS